MNENYQPVGEYKECEKCDQRTWHVHGLNGDIKCQTCLFDGIKLTSNDTGTVENSEKINRTDDQG